VDLALSSIITLNNNNYIAAVNKYYSFQNLQCKGENENINWPYNIYNINNNSEIINNNAILIALDTSFPKALEIVKAEKIMNCRCVSAGYVALPHQYCRMNWRSRQH